MPDFDGLRVLTLDGHHAQDIAQMITSNGGMPVVAPALREVLLPSDPTLPQFADRLMKRELDLIIFMSKIGTSALMSYLHMTYRRDAFVPPLQQSIMVARDSQTVSALGSFGLEPDLVSPEPHTWREVLAALDAYAWTKPVHEQCIAIQEFGIPSHALLQGLKERCACVMSVRPYEWALPEDTSPLSETIQSLCKGRIDVILFTSGVQVAHLFQVAANAGTERALKDGLENVVIASLGPTSSEHLLSFGLQADIQASRTAIETLVTETAAHATNILREKREEPTVDFLHAIGKSISGGGSIRETLERIVDFCSTVVPGDSCSVYILEGDELVLRASMNPHPREVGSLRLRLGEGITGWVATHRQPVAISHNAFQDPRFRVFNELPEDLYQAFLSVPISHREELIGVINLQSRDTHVYTRREIRLISIAAFFAGAEIERVRLEETNSQLSEELITRKLVERAKGIMQRERGMTEHDAYSSLRNQSRQLRKPLKKIAEAIVLDDIKQGAKKPGH
jgi:uroporphyrinogen-III synthase